MRTRLAVLVPFALVALIATGAAWLTAEPRGFSDYVDALDSPTSDQRRLAHDELVKGGASARAQLFAELETDRPSLAKAEIARVIAEIGVGSESQAALQSCLESPDTATRQAAIAILVSTKRGTLCIDPLRRLAADESNSAGSRIGAVTALGTGGEDAREALKSLIEPAKESHALTTAVLTALASSSLSGARDVLGLARNTEATQQERKTAIRALLAVGSKGHGLTGDLLDDAEVWMVQSAIEAAAKSGDTAHQALLRGALGDADPLVRLAALSGLISMGKEVAERAQVATRMKDADARVRAMAAQSIGRSSANIAAQVRPSLVALLTATEFNVRYEAAMALFAHGDNAGLATMQADSASTNASVAQMAAHAVGKITGRIK